MKILIFGASGFIGKALSTHFKNEGHEIIGVSRHGPLFWDPNKKVITNTELIENCDVAINLVGESIFGRYTEKKKEQIVTSRLRSTRFIVDLLLSLKNPPKLYLGASAIGYYGDRGAELLDENAKAGHDFLATLCINWEKISALLEPKMRVVQMRFGIVLDKNGGALKKMLPAFKWGLGATLGDGRQYVSWIAINDLLSSIKFVINTPSLSGAINFCSPCPITNKEMTKLVAKILNRKAFLKIPRFLLTLLMKEGGAAFLNSVRAFPKRLTESGYVFSYPKMEDALNHLLVEIK